jgi:hypothetical protein
MSAPNLGALTAALETAEKQLRRTVAEARSGWNDEARRRFDARYLDRVTVEAQALTRVVDDVAGEVDRATKRGL